MQKKSLTAAGIAASAVLVCLAGYAVHSRPKAVETMAQNDVAAVTEESTGTGDKEGPEEEQPQMTETVEDEAAESTEQEADALREDSAEAGEETGQETAEESEAESIDEMDTYLYATADVNMREGYTTDSEVIKVVAYGTKLHVTGVVENWYRVDGEGMGYISGKYLSAEEPVLQQANEATADSQSSTFDESNLTQEEKELMDYLAALNAGGPEAQNSQMAWGGGDTAIWLNK